MLAVVDQRKSVALQQIGWQQVLALVSAKWPHALQAQFSSMLEVVLPLLLGMAVVSVGQLETDVAMVSGQISTSHHPNAARKNLQWEAFCHPVSILCRVFSNLSLLCEVIMLKSARCVTSQMVELRRYFPGTHSKQ